MVARSIAAAAVSAEADGQPAVGLAHYRDYLSGLETGRIDGQAVPVITRPAGAIILSDARGGAAHPGFDLAFDDLVATARQFGLCMFVQNNAFTCGALGYFAERLAAEGLVALAATNGPAFLAGAGSTKPVYCTNPLAFAAPVDGGPPLVIDQSSSATAYVNISRAAERGEPIPEGWALDAAGKPTTDARAAMAGALVAFGGRARRQCGADGRGAGRGPVRRQLVARRAALQCRIAKPVDWPLRAGDRPGAGRSAVRCRAWPRRSRACPAISACTFPGAPERSRARRPRGTGWSYRRNSIA